EVVDTGLATPLPYARHDFFANPVVLQATHVILLERVPESVVIYPVADHQIFNGALGHEHHGPAMVRSLDTQDYPAENLHKVLAYVAVPIGFLIDRTSFRLHRMVHVGLGELIQPLGDRPGVEDVVIVPHQQAVPVGPDGVESLIDHDMPGADDLGVEQPDVG